MCVPTIGIHLNSLAHHSANQVVDWLPQGLSNQIPHRCLDAGHRSKHDWARIVLNLVQLEPEVLDVKRIHADNVPAAKIEDQLTNGSFLPFKRSIPPPYKPIIC